LSDETPATEDPENPNVEPGAIAEGEGTERTVSEANVDEEAKNAEGEASADAAGSDKSGPAGKRKKG
jgi:hypothetical protein